MPAFVTPLDKNGKVNIHAVQALMDDNYARGVHGFYVCGGTGEGPLLNVQQRKAMIDAAVETGSGRGKIIIHTGSINSMDALELTRHAAKVGADGVSSVPPSFYFKYDLKETVDFYKELADNAAGLPLIVYANTQTGAGVDVNAMMAELLKIDNICGIKDTRGSYFSMWDLKQLNGGDINVINGPDEMLISGLMAGADSGIGSTYSQMPELFVQLYQQFLAGDIAGAQATQDKINKIIKVMIGWASGNIIRVIKASLNLSGFNVGDAVYPAQPLSGEMLARFKVEMEAAGYVFSR